MRRAGTWGELQGETRRFGGYLRQFHPPRADALAVLGGMMAEGLLAVAKRAHERGHDRLARTLFTEAQLANDQYSLLAESLIARARS